MDRSGLYGGDCTAESAETVADLYEAGGVTTIASIVGIRDRSIGHSQSVNVYLLATTGLRRQELVDLNWEQVDMENQTVRVMGKGNKERLLPLHPMVLPLFHTYRETRQEFQRHPSQPVFLNRNGQRLDPRGLHRIFKQELKKAGLPPARFSLHHLRHTFATLMLQNNVQVDLRTLQELLGHESLSTVSVITKKALFS
jgi:site-specific recombinase XerD